MNKVIFLDRDGTLNYDYGYVHKISDFKLLPNVIDALKILKELGYIFIIITNQSGVARGYFTEEDVNILHNHMIELFQHQGISIEKIYTCTHLNNCNCRKPKTELFYKAAYEYDICFAESYAIGDCLRDLSICVKEPVTGILLSEVKDDTYQTCYDLLEATIWIKQRNEKGD